MNGNYSLFFEKQKIREIKMEKEILVLLDDDALFNFIVTPKNTVASIKEILKQYSNYTKRFLLNPDLETHIFDSDKYDNTPLKVVWNKIRDSAIYMYSPQKLKITSFNVGFNVMNNRVEGSEAKQVYICQQKYNGGWHDSGQTISSCSYNAADFLSGYESDHVRSSGTNFNLFGVQEVSPKYQQAFEQAILKNNPNIQFLSSGYLGTSNLVTGFDFNVTGPGVLITPPDTPFPLRLKNKKKRRGVQAIFFPKLELLFINIHAPHDIDLFLGISELGKAIEKEFQKLLKNKQVNSKPKRIIMVGDFNDHTGSLINSPIKMFNLTLKVGKKVLTCCTDANFVYPGDYIFDTKINAGYYGYPKGYVRQQPSMSDHDPVVLLDY